MNAVYRCAMRECVVRIGKTVAVIAVLVLLAANVMLFSVRIDLTEDQAFSVMPATEAVWERLEDPVAVRYYISGSLRERTAETRHIEEYLEEYVRRAGDRIELSVYDPEQSEERRREAEELGVVPQRVQLERGAESDTTRVYSGIVVEYRDRREVMPLVFEPNEIELELTSAIAALERGERRTLGVAIGDPSISVQDSLQLLANHLARRFRLRVVDLNEELPQELSGLLLVGNSELNTEAAERLERYLTSGGGVVAALDAVRVEPELGAEVQAVRNPYVADLFARYGVVVHPALVLDPENRPIPVERQVGEARFEDEEPYPFWPLISGEEARGDHPVMHGVTEIGVLWPSRLELDRAEPDQGERGRADLEHTVLARSSSDSWYLEDPRDVAPGSHNRPPPERRFSGSYPLAVAVEGEFGEHGEAEEAASERAAGRAVVISGARTLSDMQQLAAPLGTFRFIENAAHWVVGDESLTGLRRRAPTERRLDAIAHPTTRAFHAWVARSVNTFLVPLTVVIVGVWYRRRRLKRHSRRSSWNTGEGVQSSAPR